MIVLADFNVIRPDFGLIFWTTIIFGLFWFLIGKFAFKPIAEALKSREDDIQSALDESKKAREEMAALKSQNEALLAEAQAERGKILKEAKETKESIIKEAKEGAKTEASKILANAKVEIENQRKKAVTEIKNQAGTMAVEIAEQLLRSELADQNRQQELVNKLVNEIDIT